MISRAQRTKPLHMFAAHYRKLFRAQQQRVGGIKQELDPLPRVVLVPGLGLFGLGRTEA